MIPSTVIVFLCLLSSISIVKCNHRDHEIHIGHPFEYFIPSTLFDVEVNQASLKARKSLIEITFLSMYGGVTIDTWTARTGAYKSQTGIIIREKIAVTLVYMTDNEFNNTFEVLINDLNILNCLWWQQESYLYSWKEDAHIVICDDVILNTEWMFCTDPKNQTIEKQIRCGIFWDLNHPNVINWNYCQRIGIQKGDEDMQQEIYEMISTSDCITETIVSDDDSKKRHSRGSNSNSKKSDAYSSMKNMDAKDKGLSNNSLILISVLLLLILLNIVMIIKFRCSETSEATQNGLKNIYKYNTNY